MTIINRYKFVLALFCLEYCSSSFAAAPLISTQPIPVRVPVGKAANLEVGASGSGTLRYQWYFNSTAISGATAAQLSIPSAAPAQEGYYKVVVSNQDGSVTSAQALVRVLQPLTILVQPKTQLVAPFSESSLSVLAISRRGISLPGLSYQWTLRGEPIPGATSSTLEIDGLQTSAAGEYAVIVSDGFDSVRSETANLHVADWQWVSEGVPLIAAAPQPLIAAKGTAVQFQVKAVGPGLNYQWLFNGAPISNARSATLQLSSVQDANAGRYSVKVSNSAGETISAEAELRVEPLLILQSPAPAAISAGRSITLQIKVKSGPPVQYLWRHNGVPIPNSNSDKLTISSAADDDSGIYTVDVSNIYGLVVSPDAPVTVSPIIIVSQPKNVSVGVGKNTAFSVTVSGTGPFAYQWFHNGEKVGGNSSSLSLTAVQLNQAGKYSVEVLSPDNRVVSDAATLTVQGIKIVKQPQSQKALSGSDVTLSVEVAGPGPISYQWRYLGLPILGATSSQLEVKNVQPLQLGAYSVRVSNGYGSEVSANASLDVFAPPTILQQPLALLNLLPGGSALLSVVANGIPAPSYKWARNGEYIPGAVGPLLPLTSLLLGDGGSYTVTAFNASGAVESAVASIRILSLPLPFSDQFATRGEIQGSSGAGIGNNLNASRETDEPLHAGKQGARSVWLSWVAPINGIVTFTTAGSGFDTLLGIYSGQTLNALTFVAADDEAGGFHTSKATFVAQAGVRYEIAVDAFNQEAGNISLSWQSTPSILGPLTIKQQPVNTTVSYGAPALLGIDFLSALPVGIQWFLNDTPVAGNQKLLMLPAVLPANLGAYSARLSVGGLTLASSAAEVQINTEGISTAFAANRLADAGVIGGPLARQSIKGRLGMKSAAPVRGYSGSQMFQTYPGKDPGEPNVCGVPGGASYWLSYQPPASGILTLNTDGSNFNTLLGVYVDNGSNQGYASLVCVTCDDNGGANGQTSSVAFQADAGRTYYVVVDGVYGATGTAYLSYNLNSNVNRAPVAGGDGFSRPTYRNLQIYSSTLMGNDYDSDGDRITLTGISTSSYYGGRVSSNQSCLYYYPPSWMNQSYYYTDYISYTISDGRGGTTTGTISISTNPNSTSASYGAYAF